MIRTQSEVHHNDSPCLYSACDQMASLMICGLYSPRNGSNLASYGCLSIQIIRNRHCVLLLLNCSVCFERPCIDIVRTTETSQCHLSHYHTFSTFGASVTFLLDDKNCDPWITRAFMSILSIPPMRFWDGFLFKIAYGFLHTSECEHLVDNISSLLWLLAYGFSL